MGPELLEHILDGREKPTNLHLSLLRNITKNFSEEQILGKGGSGVVYKVRLEHIHFRSGKYLTKTQKT
jgi:predicted Ser/Thr protein kinase